MQDSFFVALGIYALVVVSPGPAFVFMTKVGLQENRAVAFCSMLGYVCGATTNAAIAMFAVGTMAEQHAGVGLFVSTFGGGFLILLAADSIRKARASKQQAQQASAPQKITTQNKRQDKKEGKKADKKEDKPRSKLGGFRKGLLVSLSNPKALAFFVAVFAPLVAGLPLQGKGVLLAFGFSVKFLWYGSVVVVFKRAGIQRVYRRNAFVYDGLLGVVFVGMGLFIFWEARHYWALLF